MMFRAAYGGPAGRTHRHAFWQVLMANPPKRPTVDENASPYVKNLGKTRMVVERPLTTQERAVIDQNIHAMMDAEERISFHLNLFKQQLGGLLKKTQARRLRDHKVWKAGKSNRVIEVEVVVDDRAQQVMRVDPTNGDVVTKRAFDHREQLEMFQNTPDRIGVPEMDDAPARKLEADINADREELAHLLANVNWSAIQKTLCDELGITVEELQQAAGGRGGKKKRGPKVDEDAKGDGGEDDEQEDDE